MLLRTCDGLTQCVSTGWIYKKIFSFCVLTSHYIMAYNAFRIQAKAENGGYIYVYLKIF